MQTILKGLRDLDGVNGTFLSDMSGQVIAFSAESIYDAPLLTQVSRAIATAIDSVRLIQEDWDSITTQFTEGRLLIRSIATTGRKSTGPLTLSLIADSRLNPSFATVAIRVAIGKIRALAEANDGAIPLSIDSAGVTPATTPRQVPPANPMGGHSVAQAVASSIGEHTAVTASEIASSGLHWSGLGGSSTLSASGVAVADAVSSALLTSCTKLLANAVGPMAKVFVKDAVRKISAGQPFSKAMYAALITELEKEIEDLDDAAAFRKNASKLV